MNLPLRGQIIRGQTKGRGALSNREGRFETLSYSAVDDGWDSMEQEIIPSPQTQVREETIRTLITTNQSPDIPFEQSINPYRGCEHGCIYCYARPSHAFLGHSPGLDFETQLYAKTKAAAVLEQAFLKPKYQPKTITLGSNTDPYQPIEKSRQITRQLLKVMLEFRHPLVIISKGALILRDLDILSELAARKLVQVIITVTTLDRTLARALEPRASTPHRRIQIIEHLHEAKIPVSVNAAPMIPALNDSELEAILGEAAQAGAQAANYILLRLPGELKEIFWEWLQCHYPNRAKHVMSQLRQAHGGKEYEAQFGVRFTGRGAYAQMLHARYKLACKRLALNQEYPSLDVHAFRRPARIGEQLNLFDS